MARPLASRGAAAQHQPYSNRDHGRLSSQMYALATCAAHVPSVVQHLANLLWAFATLELHPGRWMMDAVVEVLSAVSRNLFTCIHSTGTGLEHVGHRALLIGALCSPLACDTTQLVRSSLPRELRVCVSRLWWRALRTATRRRCPMPTGAQSIPQESILRMLPRKCCVRSRMGLPGVWRAILPRKSPSCVVPLTLLTAAYPNSAW